MIDLLTQQNTQSKRKRNGDPHRALTTSCRQIIKQDYEPQENNDPDLAIQIVHPEIILPVSGYIDEAREYQQKTGSRGVKITPREVGYQQGKQDDHCNKDRIVDPADHPEPSVGPVACWRAEKTVSINYRKHQ